MPGPTLSFQFLSRVALTSLVFVFAAVLRAETSQGGFSATLSVDQKSASGLATLTPEERDALDQLVRADVSEARSDGATEFEGTFAARHTNEELHRAGLDRLTPAQLKKLEALIATAVAAGPKPKERPRLRDSDVLNPSQTKPQVHGGVSLTYGHVSGAGDFKGGSMWVNVFDPKTGLSLGIGVSQFNGPRLRRFGYGRGYLDYDYFPGYFDYGPDYGFDDGYGFYDGLSRDTTSGVIGVGNQMFEASYGWQRSSAYYRDFRRN